ncbi:methyltransferase-like protein 7A [Trichonephila inaurata madagascariensis]|uniref:Methyltransferase-like protein 7A n=1 Tax=Trichonephila inaurata madagascariensis TaxID=2747483 RepID=A0A8X6X1M7_9ARAC|nr:methyltransferase-like protein 7A [Trichonephila inaurata madagascariensis]
MLLLFSDAFRSFTFPYIYLYIILPFFNYKIIPSRKKTFKLLNDHLAGRDSSKPLEVLEIGIGGGANLEYFPENCNLTVVDKNKFFEPYFKQNAKRYPHINYKRTIIQCAENMTEIEDNSFEVVVTSYFQCSCDDPEAVVKEIIRVLKPGGKYICMEHVGFPENTIGLYLQKLAYPIWYLYSNGCTPQRDLAKVIKRAGFSEVICKN